MICDQDIFSLVANFIVKEPLYLSDHGSKIKTGKTRTLIKLSSNKKRFDKECRLRRHKLRKLATKKHIDPLNPIIREQYHDTDAIQEEKRNKYYNAKISKLEKSTDNSDATTF